MPGILISQITIDNIKSISEDLQPILVACIRKDNDMEDKLADLRNIAGYFQGNLHVYYALEDMFPFFEKNYNVQGTPTYLILHNGTILGSSLGKNSHQNLIKLTNDILKFKKLNNEI